METQQDILVDLDETILYQDASVGVRFLNYLIDMILVVFIAIATEIFFFPELVGSTIGNQVLTYTLLFVYYALFETATNGRTIGKFITGTKAIREDGGGLSGGDAALRSVSRLVPFEAFSAFSGNPWHDRWTKTRVVKTR